MKLSARDAAAFFRKPDPAAPALLIHGDDVMRVALRRQETVAALIGPDGESEMRLTRLQAADLRRDPAALLDAVKAVGFFPGARVALVEDATDALADTLSAALADWRPGDAQIVVTAGALPAKSRLRKLFEGHKTALSAQLFDTPPTRDEIAADLSRAGLRDPDRDAMAALEDLARALGPGDFRQVLDKIALYKLDDPAPLSAADVAANAPASVEADVDEICHVLAEGRSGDIATVMARLQAQGVTPVSLLITGARHFRTLYALASAPGGPAQAIGRMRPPIWGPRRDRMLRQAGQWRLDRLEEALVHITDTDLKLRSAAQHAPAMALVERCFVRLAHLARR